MTYIESFAFILALLKSETIFYIIVGYKIKFIFLSNRLYLTKIKNNLLLYGYLFPNEYTIE